MTRTRGTAVAAALLLAAGLSACSSSQPQAAPSPSAPTATEPAPTPSASPSPSASASSGTSPQDQVEQVALVTGDLGDGLTVKVIDGGDSVTGQPTLDNCGYKYTTESHRVARHQVEVLTSTGDEIGVSNEVVAYDSVAEATKALAEYRASVTHCPKNVYEKLPASEGAPPVRYLSSTLSSSTGLPLSDNAIARIHAVFKASPPQPSYSFVVMQVHGTILDAVYLSDTTPLPADAIAVATQLADLTGQRLAALAAATDA